MDGGPPPFDLKVNPDDHVYSNGLTKIVNLKTYHDPSGFCIITVSCIDNTVWSKSFYIGSLYSGQLPAAKSQQWIQIG